jgi:hypothetical protein
MVRVENRERIVIPRFDAKFFQFAGCQFVG